MEEWLALVIAGAFTLAGTALGALIGLKGARRLSRDERAVVERAETVRAFKLYVTAAVQIVSELRQIPPAPEPNPVEEAIGGVFDRLRGEAGTQMATRARLHRLYGDRHHDLGDRLSAAYIDVRLRDLPANARAAIDETNDYIERLSDQRTNELIARWKEVHAHLIAVGEELREGSPHISAHTLPANDDGPRPAEAPAEGRNASNHGHRPA